LRAFGGHDHRKSALERAFELARSGSCLSIRDIAFKLNSEKYDISHLEGPALRKQFQDLIDEAIKPKEQ
jgi:hypothetical protein